MKSIILASLLAVGGAFFMNGCDAEDVVEAFTGDEVSTVYFLNGNSVSIVAEVEDKSKPLTPGSFDYFSFFDDSALDTQYTISGQRQGHIGLNKGTTHVYVSTSCNQQGYLTHPISSSQRIQVINIRGTEISNGEYSVTINGVEVLDESVSASNCAVTPTNVTTTKGNIIVRQNGEIKYSDYLAEDYSFDIVVLPGNSVKVIPLITLDNLH